MNATQIVIAGCITEDKRVLLVPTTSGWVLPYEKVHDATDVFEAYDALAAVVDRTARLVCRPQDRFEVPHRIDGYTAMLYCCDIGMPVETAQGCHYIQNAAQISLAPVMEQFLRPLLDILSILTDPVIKPNEYPDDVLPVEGIFLSDNGEAFYQETARGRYEHPRLRA